MVARIGVSSVEKSLVPLPGIEHRFFVYPSVAYHCSYWLNYLESKNIGRGNNGEKGTIQKRIKLKFYVHMTVHRNKFLFNKSNRRTDFPNLFLSRNSTCFGQFLCTSSGIFHCTFGTGICHTSLTTAFKLDHPGRYVEAVGRRASTYLLLTKCVIFS